MPQDTRDKIQTVRTTKQLLQTLKDINIALAENLTTAEYNDLYSAKIDIELALDLT